MSLSMRIAPHLALLRRFARAVTGSQTSGDAYVAAMLEALIADIEIFPQTSSDRISVYQLFCKLFDQTTPQIPEPLPSLGAETQAGARLSCLTPRARQAFLLVAVEGFEEREAAEVLDTSSKNFKKLLAEAARDISEQVATRILIIEDEPLIAMDIEQMVQGLGHQVVGIARTHKEAVALFKDKEPGMVLADIQLADGSSGIDAVNDILRELSLPVIFITAFPERLLTGERPEPTFLVTKPFNPDMVKALISQALFFQDNARNSPDKAAPFVDRELRQ
ncbi:MAG: Two component system response regulator [Candidatus Tokpelaia hoelldobleri]|uniref:Two component system response regulator n=1 Tax=Candidatus Tokpelaia hoelldobleri TaxID=1902579 RepID=A0A1U9JWE7_9HYPH|nr:MAG: Two component system response regulator [Candidatus Tokpelaia hoelldoblerii]